MIALVLGGAACRWEDVERATGMIGRRWDLVVGVNEACCKRDGAGRAWTGPFDVLATLHAEKVFRWRHARAEMVRSLGRSPAWDPYEVWSSVRRTAVDRHFRGWTNGSSGLYAVSVALEMGATRVVVCGCPLDDRENAFRGERWTAFNRYRAGWTKRAEELRPRVRSMSGWTAELLGTPDARWLAQEVAA